MVARGTTGRLASAGLIADGSTTDSIGPAAELLVQAARTAAIWVQPRREEIVTKVAESGP